MNDNDTLRDKYLIQDYLAGKNIAELARTSGLGDRRVAQILNEHQVPLRPREPNAEKKPLSKVHERIGRLMIDHRFDQGLQPNEAANAIGWSLVKLRGAERGISKLELLDLIDIASYTGCDLTEMVTLVKNQ